MALNKDGSYGSKATNRELAEFWGEVAARDVARATDPAIVLWEFYQKGVWLGAERAAHFGRIALRQARFK